MSESRFGSGWRVMIVEDQEDSVQLLKQVFDFYGCEVIVAHDGQQCLQQMDEAQPDLVIMDLSLPGMDGWATLRTLRAQERTAELPVVAVTAYHNHSLEQLALDAGFDGYLPKPLSPATLVDDLNNILGRRGMATSN